MTTNGILLDKRLQLFLTLLLICLDRWFAITQLFSIARKDVFFQISQQKAELFYFKSKHNCVEINNKKWKSSYDANLFTDFFC